jgi:small-conductance mechanosensitive channel
MEKGLSLTLGTTLSVLAIAGFVMPKKHFVRLMNVDVNHSVLRVPLTLALLYAGTHADLKVTRKILCGIGVFYVCVGSAGLADKRVGGLLPSGLTSFDIVYHFAVGLGAIWMGNRPGRMLKP